MPINPWRRGGGATMHMAVYHCSPLQKEWETRAAEKVDDLLESFMGIRDMELGEVAREIHTMHSDEVGHFV